MRSVPICLAAALLPQLVAAQPAGLNIACLDATQQAEVTAQARAIAADVAERRPVVEAALQGGFTLADASSRQTAVNLQMQACAAEARRAGRSTLEACERHFVELRVLADVINDLTRNPKAPVDLLAREERLRLDSLRARYPRCESAATAQR